MLAFISVLGEAATGLVERASTFRLTVATQLEKTLSELLEKVNMLCSSVCKLELNLVALLLPDVTVSYFAVDWWTQLPGGGLLSPSWLAARGRFFQTCL